MTDRYPIRRQHERKELFYRVSVDTGLVETSEAVLQDISLGGACLGLTESVPDVGTEVTFYIHHGGQDEIALPAVVVRCHEVSYAVRFPRATRSLLLFLEAISPIARDVADPVPSAI